MDYSDTKLKFLLLILLQITSKIKAVTDTCSSLSDGITLKVNIRSIVNATDYRILTAHVEKSSKMRKEQLSVDLIQSEKSINNTKVISFDIVTAVPAFTRIDDGYEFFPGFGRYKLYTFPVTWPEAKKRCEDDDAHLLVMETPAEVEVLKAFFARKPTFPEANHATCVSVGVYDIKKNFNFVTLLGKELNSLEYKSLHIWHKTDGLVANYVCADSNGNMHDFPNEWKLGYICEAY